MTDRELLEAAAKAVGLHKPNYVQDGFSLGWQQINGIAVESGPTSQRLWNPLTDDGDALRLAVKLRLTVYQWSEECCACNEKGTVNESVSFIDADHYVATRRAIVRAAAAIGKDMK